MTTKEQNLIEQLVKKLEKEIEDYRGRTMLMTAKDIYDRSYETIFKENFYDLIWGDDSSVAEALGDLGIQFLLRQNNVLDCLYSTWLGCDNALSLNWDDMIDTLQWIVQKNGVQLGGVL